MYFWMVASEPFQLKAIHEGSEISLLSVWLPSSLGPQLTPQTSLPQGSSVHLQIIHDF